MSVLRAQGAGVVDAAQNLHHSTLAALYFLCHLYGAGVLGGVVFISQCAAVYIALLQQILINRRGKCRRDCYLCAVGIGQDLPRKQPCIHGARACGHRLCQPLLQGGGKFAERHIGDQRQLVQLLHLAAQHAFVHALAVLVDAQAQTAPDFLTAADFRFPLRFQRADLEHIRVIPALAQGRVREDKPHRLVQTQQAFLVAHNQVVGVGVVAGLGLAVNLALHKAGFLALFLVDGKIPLMAAVGVHTVQVRPIRSKSKAQH